MRIDAISDWVSLESHPFSAYSLLYTLCIMKQRHDVSNQVRALRIENQMTQQDLAARVGVTRQTILSIEKEKYTPSVALALSIARVFGVNVEAVFQLRDGEGHD